MKLLLATAALALILPAAAFGAESNRADSTLEARIRQADGWAAWNVPMIPSTALKKMTGEIEGSVMCHVFRHADAPSRSAAS